MDTYELLWIVKIRTIYDTYIQDPLLGVDLIRPQFLLSIFVNLYLKYGKSSTLIILLGRHYWLFSLSADYINHALNFSLKNPGIIILFKRIWFKCAVLSEIGQFCEKYSS